MLASGSFDRLRKDSIGIREPAGLHERGPEVAQQLRTPGILGPEQRDGALEQDGRRA